MAAGAVQLVQSEDVGPVAQLHMTISHVGSPNQTQLTAVLLVGHVASSGIKRNNRQLTYVRRA